MFDNSYGEHFCVDVPECAAVCAEQRDAAKAEAQQWQNELAIYKLTENERVKHLESCEVVMRAALRAAERVIASAHAYWDSDQDAKVGKLLIAMLSDDLKYSDDCTAFRTGIKALAGQPAPKPKAEVHFYAGWPGKTMCGEIVADRTSSTQRDRVTCWKCLHLLDGSTAPTMPGPKQPPRLHGKGCICGDFARVGCPAAPKSGEQGK